MSWKVAKGRFSNYARRALRFSVWVLNPFSSGGIQFWVSLALSVIFRLATLRKITFQPLAYELFYDLAIVISANSIVLFVRFVQLRDVLQALLKIFTFSDPAIRPGFLEFTAAVLRQIRNKLEGLRGEGALLSKEEVDELAYAFFLATDARYDGVDSHEPSTYMEEFSRYLEAHSVSLRRGAPHGTRILSVDLPRLALDYHMNKDAVNKFLAWHETNKIELKRIDSFQVEELCKKHNLKTADVGIWKDRFALQFFESEPSEDLGKRRIALEISDSIEYRRLLKYMQEVISQAEPLTKAEIEATARNLSALTFEDIAPRWNEYVNCERRLVREGPFLLGILKEHNSLRILDAACGTGCESIFLLQNGFEVISNEVDMNLLAEAEKNARNQDVFLNTRTFNWLEIGDRYGAARNEKGQLFDVILLLGNSICLLLDKKQQKKAITQLSSLLKPGGIMIVDERNFQYMLDHPEVTSLEKFPFSGEIMYCGSSIRGLPEKIKSRTVVFNLIDIGSNTVLKTFLLYPFKKKELPALLRECGFRSVDTYYDFARKRKDNAEFITHVAIKGA